MLGVVHSQEPHSQAGARSYLRYWVPVVLWLAVIVLLSSDLGSRSTTEGGLLDLLARWAPELAARLDGAAWVDTAAVVVRQTGHFVEYGVLGLLAGRAVWRTTALSTATVVVLVTTGAVGVAALDELHQAYVPTRTGSLADVATDGAGALVAVGIIVAVASWRGASRGGRKV